MNAADFTVEQTEGGSTLHVIGDWNALAMGDVADRVVHDLRGRKIAPLDLARLGKIDTAGTFVLLRIVEIHRENRRCPESPVVNCEPVGDGVEYCPDLSGIAFLIGSRLLAGGANTGESAIRSIIFAVGGDHLLLRSDRADLFDRSGKSVGSEHFGCSPTEF
ncbi:MULTISPECIES: hypothetical protein [unclassified Sphingobium]|jgi:ABC-type transporter Mla MlaB component|uniref:hypothetical protein n=1 Tax=unclassified Sphingobium TaxID=2611147 RepID=UPI000C9F4AF4|nr:MULTISPECIES: hypothetical protein [unclassified Sphingobium]PNQ03419.1 hypothetical protein A8G00_11235 [Sphingobium sp. SA916]WDA35220.1 hypothetical protein PO876_17355 [Sphingobium sp. YC-XJ3]WDA37244.1 hypothetical protein PO876_03305 [Sphingobium sp. YC-XJ3]WDA38811.1 hypothetical protein PO876_11855 [Sphingobium sp. YC-XJ3]